MTEYNNHLFIGGSDTINSKCAIYPWDTFSDTFGNPLNCTDYAVTNMQVLNGILYYFTFTFYVLRVFCKAPLFINYIFPTERYIRRTLKFPTSYSISQHAFIFFLYILHDVDMLMQTSLRAAQALVVFVFSSVALKLCYGTAAAP
jgi:hypothetical protein